jgi:DNA-binding MarR family transcriptional regulator
MSAYWFVFGAGLGLVMQVLVVAVQNAVPYEELGTATSGTSFFRMIGGSFGTAVFGAIFANLLAGNLRHYLGPVRLPANSASQIDNPALLAKLPPAIHAGVVEGVAHTVQTVFLVGVPVAAAAFLLSWLLPEVPLRRSIATPGTGEALAVHEHRTSLQELQRSLAKLASRENRADLYRTLAGRAGLDLAPRACWLIYRLAERPGATLDSVCADLKVAPARVEEALEALAGAGLVGPVAGSRTPLVLTDAGRAAIERLSAARRTGLTELLEGWDLDAHPEVEAMVRQLAHALLADDEKLLADSRRKVEVGG